MLMVPHRLHLPLEVSNLLLTPAKEVLIFCGTVIHPRSLLVEMDEDIHLASASGIRRRFAGSNVNQEVSGS